ncbi:MAG TPA: MarR family transcriptional regulator [Ktedonobacterales bacterium]
MSKENPEELVNSVAREIAEFQDAAGMVDEAVAQRMGINLTDLRCLGLLLRHGAMGAGQLAAAAELSPGAMTAALDRLERLGYIARVRSSTDRRGVIVEVTPTAYQLLEACYGPLGLEGLARLEQYSAAELILLRDFLRQGRELQMRHAARIRSRDGASSLNDHA